MTTELQAASTERERHLLLRIGAVLAIAGPILLILSGIPHGDLPTNEPGLVDEVTALRYVADHQTWLPIHMATVVAGLLWVGAFVALAGTLTPGAARVAGWFLLPSAVVGGVFAAFDYLVDGYALKVLADQWAAASGPEEEAMVRMADTGIWLLTGVAQGEVIVMFGLTFLLAGVAVVLDGRYPRLFGVIGAVAGGAVLLSGLARIAGLDLSPSEGVDFLFFLVIVPVDTVWLLTLGVLMWRRANRRVPAGRG
jgi:hypothetical protein